jgi:hypothetical protein
LGVAIGRPERGRCDGHRSLPFSFSLLLPLQLNSSSGTGHERSMYRVWSPTQPRCFGREKLRRKQPQLVRASQPATGSHWRGTPAPGVWSMSYREGTPTQPTVAGQEAEVGGALPSRPAPPLAIKQASVLLLCGSGTAPCPFFALKARACARRYSTAQCMHARYC